MNVPRRFARGVVGLAVVGVAVVALAAADERVATSDAFRETFETIDTAWTLEGGDVNRNVRVHERTSDNAHSGQRSERIALSSGSGTHLYYSYPIQRALVTDDLKISVYVKSDRSGLQVLARVVFPRERDPDTLQLLGTLVTGSVYEQAGRWQRLELGRPDLGMERQARLLRASLQRDIDTREAYIDRVLLNVYGGPGDVTVLIDDLEVSPLVSDGVRVAGAQLGPPASNPDPGVEINQDRLLVAGRARFLRAVRAPGVSPARLKDFGFNVLSIDWPLDLQVIEEAVNSGLWLMPQVPIAAEERQDSSVPLSQTLGQLPFSESVLCWSLGTGLAGDSWNPVTEAVRELRGVSPRRPIAADVTGNFRGYSRELDMIGAHRMPIGTSLDLRQYRDWLSHRRFLARAGTYFYTWIQASAATLEQRHAVVDAGPDPDQLRLMTYAALASGCRGLAFWCDESLGRPGPGHDRLLQLGLLNLELQLLEPYFAASGSPTTVSVETTSIAPKRGPGAEIQDRSADFRGKGRFVGSFAPLKKQADVVMTEREEIQATLLRTDRGLIVIPVWYGPGAQFVAGQLAANDLSMIVPGLPDAAQAWWVTPAEVRMLKRERVAGGTRLVVPEFDLTGIILITNDLVTLNRLRREVAKTSPFAALWATELATSELATAKHVNSQLVGLGHPQPDAFALLQTADERLLAARRAMESSDFARTYQESLRAMRAVRVLKRAHWDDAVVQCTHLAKAIPLTVPHSSPYAVSFAGLPRHWKLVRDLQSGSFGPNLVVGGDFESVEALSEDGWTQIMNSPESLELDASLSAHEPRRGERSLHLSVRPQEGANLPVTIDPLLAALVSKPMPVRPGDIVRIQFWLRVPDPIEGTSDGAVVFDSIGGPALAITHSDPLEWKQFTLYRHVAQPDELTVTIGLTGIGDVYVDDLTVQRLSPSGELTRGDASSRVVR